MTSLLRLLAVVCTQNCFVDELNGTLYNRGWLLLFRCDAVNLGDVTKEAPLLSIHLGAQLALVRCFALGVAACV